MKSASLHRLLDAFREAQRSTPARRRIGELGEGAVGEGHHLADLALGFRIGIGDRDVDAVLDEARRPAAADDATADDRGFAHAGHDAIIHAS